MFALMLVLLLQAITLIVTHRTDDMSKLPPVVNGEVLRKPKQAAGLPQWLLCLSS